MTATSTTRRSLLGTAAAIATVGALLLPASAAAQQPLTPVRVTATNTAADRLDSRAVAYEQGGDIRRFGKAARLRERAAGLRAPDDPAGFKSLRMAAILRHGLGHLRHAGYLMERAGDQAIARGDVFNAATAYIDAAYIAADQRDGERTRDLVGRGTLLLHSPLLSEQQRGFLGTRVAGLAPSPAVEVATHP
jgi:hypothetical protein